MYGHPGPPEPPRATSSPTIILLCSGLAATLGFLFGFFAGLGSGEPMTAPGPRVTVTVEDSSPPEEPLPSATAPSGTAPTATGPAATPPPATPPPVTTGVSQFPTPTANPDVRASGLAGNRTLMVGADIQPGTYRTTGPAAGQKMCYWARLKGTGGVSDVIAADMVAGPATVTVQPTDKVFQTGGCAEWVRA